MRKEAITKQGGKSYAKGDRKVVRVRKTIFKS